MYSIYQKLGIKIFSNALHCLNVCQVREVKAAREKEQDIAKETIDTLKIKQQREKAQEMDVSNAYKVYYACIIDSWHMYPILHLFRSFRNV